MLFFSLLLFRRPVLPGIHERRSERGLHPPPPPKKKRAKEKGEKEESRTESPPRLRWATKRKRREGALEKEGRLAQRRKEGRQKKKRRPMRKKGKEKSVNKGTPPPPRGDRTNEEKPPMQCNHAMQRSPLLLSIFSIGRRVERGRREMPSKGSHRFDRKNKKKIRTVISSYREKGMYVMQESGGGP